MTDPKEPTDLEQAIAAVSKEDADDDAELGEAGLEDGDEGEDKAESVEDGKAKPSPDEKAWEEYERTGNPHLIPDPHLRKRALEQERKFTEKFEKVARMSDRIKELEGERPAPAAKTTPETDDLPSLGDGVDPALVKLLDARNEALVTRVVEKLGLGKRVEEVRTTLAERQAQEYAENIMRDLKEVQKLTDEDIEYASEVMCKEDPRLAVLLQTPKGRVRFAKLVRDERGITAAKEKEINDKASAGDSATVRPSSGKKTAKKVEDWSKASKEDILAHIASERQRLGVSG